MSLWSEGMRLGRLFFEYRKFLRERYTLDDCKRMLRERMNTRERRFLDLARSAIFENPASPYLPLLAEAQCAYDDLASQVSKDGIEATLRALRRAGAYVTFEQFKYGTPLECGGRTYQFAASDFDNPLITNFFAGSSGGTRSRGTPMRLGLGWIAEWAVYEALRHEAYNTRDAVKILWLPGLPAVSGFVNLLYGAKVGMAANRWFTMVDSAAIQASFLSRFGMMSFVHLGRLFGTPMSRAEHLPLSEAAGLARLIANLKREGRAVILTTYASCCVRVCQAAREGGLDVSGVKMVLSAEPATPGKVNEVKAVGAVPLARYDCAEVGVIGATCPYSQEADDYHHFNDLHAVIQDDSSLAWGDQELGAFIFTSLSGDAAKILLNVEMDDCGIVETKSCGCGFEEVGFTEHLRHIRSFTKLSLEGMTFMSRDFLRIIEESLPRRYGGASTDYQLVETEDAQGLTRLAISIHPRLGSIDERAVLRTVREELMNDPHARRETRQMMVEILSKAGTLSVRREPPVATQQGKLMPFHRVES